MSGASWDPSHRRGYSRYGADMGRSGSEWTGPVGGKVHLVRVRLDRGGYDTGGAYWGSGAPLWVAYEHDGDGEMYFRAKDRAAAKAHLLATHPGARFYR